MQVHVYYQGMESSHWMEQFMASRLSKLERFLGGGASIQVNLKFEDRTYSTGLVIHQWGRDFFFSDEGENLYEAFSGAFDKATRSLGEEKRRIKDKINRRYNSVA